MSILNNEGHDPNGVLNAGTGKDMLLCVGGPLDRKRHGPTNQPGFTATMLGVDGFKPVRYQMEIFHTPQGDVSFWVPEGQTPLETIKLLLSSYQRNKT